MFKTYGFIFRPPCKSVTSPAVADMLSDRKNTFQLKIKIILCLLFFLKRCFCRSRTASLFE